MYALKEFYSTNGLISRTISDVSANDKSVFVGPESINSRPEASVRVNFVFASFKSVELKL